MGVVDYIAASSERVDDCFATANEIVSIKSAGTVGNDKGALAMASCHRLLCRARDMRCMFNNLFSPSTRFRIVSLVTAGWLA